MPPLNEISGRPLMREGEGRDRTPADGEALASFDKAIARDSQSESADARVRVARALLAKAKALADLERFDDAVETYEQVIERFEKASEIDLRRSVAAAHGMKGFALVCAGR